MKTIAIITAGGSGNRLPGECKKQFRLIKGKPVLAYTIDNFYKKSIIDGIIVTVPAEDLEEAIHLLHPFYPDADINILEGGKTRQHSVLRALNTVPEDTDYVMIHDGVRPFVSLKEMTDMLRICREVNAVIPVQKVKNTVKEIDDNRVVRTMQRELLAEVFTPQVFRYELIAKYHRLAEQYGYSFTDDAAVLEHHGVPVFAYDSEGINIKITDRYDFDIVRLILENDIMNVEE